MQATWCAQSHPMLYRQSGRGATVPHQAVPIGFSHPENSQLPTVLSGHTSPTQQCHPPRAAVVFTNQNKQQDKAFPWLTHTWRNNKSQCWPKKMKVNAHTLLPRVITFDPVFNAFPSELEPRYHSQCMQKQAYFGRCSFTASQPTSWILATGFSNTISHTNISV